MNYIVYFRSKCSAFITWTENSPRGHRKFLTVKVWRRVWACFSVLSVINVTWMKTLSRRFRAAGLKFLRFRFMWRQRTRPPAGKKREVRHCALRCVLTLSVQKLSIRWFLSDGEQMFRKTVTRVHTSAFTEQKAFFFFRWHTWCVLCLSSSHLLKHNSHQQEEEGGRRAEVWAAQQAAGKEDGGKDVAGCSGSQI